jgi:UTP-glucose-1-phosphate uridylyltransferase
LAREQVSKNAIAVLFPDFDLTKEQKLAAKLKALENTKKSISGAQQTDKKGKPVENKKSQIDKQWDQTNEVTKTTDRPKNTKDMS